MLVYNSNQCHGVNVVYRLRAFGPFVNGIILNA